MSDIYDLIILGAGPAGITSAVYAARKRLEFLLISPDIGGQAALSGDIENYTGYQFITGPELALKFQDHMSAFNIPLNIPDKAIGVFKQPDSIKVTTEKGEYFSRALIISTGKRPRPLDVEGEDEYRNKGLTYCATCDGPLFKGKIVAVIGGGNSALDAALQLMKISPLVYIINITDNLSGDPVMIEKVAKSANAKILNNARVKRIYGDVFVKGIEVEQNGGKIDLEVEGIFVEIGLIPNSGFIDIVDKNERTEIIVDCYNRTNIEGIFAAGDVTNVPEKQIIIACGEGSKATLSAFRFLSTHKF